MSNTRNPYIELRGKLNVTGDNINRIRVQQNLSIYDIESGKRTVADYELCAIAEMLNTSSDILLKDFSNFIKEEKK